MTAAGDRAARYARPEWERRFLLAGIPEGLAAGRHIHDRYLRGTRLRLRLVEDESGSILEMKLGHKVRPDADDPRLVLHTSLYLSPAEFAVLEALPADGLAKVRYAAPGTPHAAVDVFAGDLSGLVMMEVNYSSASALAEAAPPPGSVREVTGLEAFTGGALAATTAEQLARLGLP